MGKSKAALPDLSKVIELKGDFISVCLSFAKKKFQLFIEKMFYSRHEYNEEIYY